MKFPLNPFRKKSADRRPQVGDLLVSEPYMSEFCFFRSVILLVEHDSSGWVGLVLNKPMHLHLPDVLRHKEDIPNVPLFQGGPVGLDRLLYLHDLGDSVPDSIPVKGKICFNGNFESLASYLKEGLLPHQNVYFFLGYAGWAPGQLEGELAQDAWSIAPLEEDDLNLCPTGGTFWRAAASRLDDFHRSWLSYPKFPSLN